MHSPPIPTPDQPPAAPPRPGPDAPEPEFPEPIPPEMPSTGNEPPVMPTPHALPMAGA